MVHAFTVVSWIGGVIGMLTSRLAVKHSDLETEVYSWINTHSGKSSYNVDPAGLGH
jgi:hypothetical protein